jgi:hypothetical protein
MTLRSSLYGTEVSRLGTDRSSMETLLLTCIQLQLITGRINSNNNLTPIIKNELILELNNVSPEECKIDAKAD